MDDVFGEFSDNVIDGAAEAVVHKTVDTMTTPSSKKPGSSQPVAAQAKNAPPPVEIVNDIPGFEDCSISQAGTVVAVNLGVAGAVGGGMHVAGKYLAGRAATNAASQVATKTVAKEGVKLFGKTAIKSIPLVGAIAGVGIDSMTLKDDLDAIKEWETQTGRDVTFFGNAAYREAVLEAGLKFTANMGLNVASFILAPTGFGPAALQFLAAPAVNSVFIANDIVNPDLIQMNKEFSETLNKGGGLSMNRVADATIEAAKVAGNKDLAEDLERMRAEKDPAFVYTINAVARDMVNNRNPGGTLKMMCDKGADGHCELAAIAQEVRNELARNQEMQQAIAGVGKDTPNLQPSDGITSGVGGRALTPEEMSAMRVAAQSAANGFPAGTIVEHVEDGLPSRGVTPATGGMVARATRPRGNPVNSI